MTETSLYCTHTTSHALSAVRPRTQAYSYNNAASADPVLLSVLEATHTQDNLLLLLHSEWNWQALYYNRDFQQLFLTEHWEGFPISFCSIDFLSTPPYNREAIRGRLCANSTRSSSSHTQLIISYSIQPNTLHDPMVQVL